MQKIQSEVVKTSCGQCYIGCAIEVQVDDGVVTNISGNPDSPQNRGKMCAKGKAGVMNLYNPNRVKVPLKRTSSEKGMDVDPGWVEISWDEAIDTIVSQFERIRDTPQKLLIQPWEVMGDNLFWLSSFGSAFGAYLASVVASPDCGKVVHPVEYFSGGGFHQQPDLHHANYCILIGTQFGIASRSSFNHHLLDMANARERGMKLVVIDPVGGYAGSKANEWVPIRPGTDAAWGLSMLHVLLNELEVYDRAFLANKTNAPYLVGPDGHYIRDPSSGAPLVFDLADNATKSHDDPGLKQPSISGRYLLGEVRARTAFDLLREHVAKYRPEATEAITTIPAATVRRIAREFGQAACIGQTIEIDGVELPYRPVCVDWAKGAQGHKHGFHNCWPLKLLNIVVGSVNVPGGIMSTGAAGKYPHRWWPESGTDGMLEHGGQIFPMGHPSSFPGRAPARPLRADIAELFPLAPHYHTMLPIVFDDPSKFGLSGDAAIEMLMHSPNNSILGNFGDIAQVERFYKSLRFIFGFAVEINETTLFDDIVLPFPSYLERWDFIPGVGAYYIAPCGQDDFHWQVRQPVVDLPPEMRQPQEVIQEIADRLGILPGMYRLLNHTFSLKGAHKLEAGERYRVPEIIDKATRSWFGDDRGLAWFQEHGVIRHPRDVEEAYIGANLDARIPVYLEHFLTRGEQLAAVVKEMKLDWDLSDYKALSDWMPCPSFTAIRSGEYDLIAVHFKFPFVYGSYGAENPWIDEICGKTHAYKILINTAVARKKGIEQGDSVWLESPVRKVRAVVRVTECIHPEAVGIGGHFGHWSPGMPISRGKGVSFNALCPSDLDHIDMISTALDQCVQVKVYK
ncbi:MAG: molybdopterin-dependent oxidoreductase [Burkholderiaceae bacterium]|nr:molybdopterin-dependent oxidoreductase [Burkholderiaceae bacterium]